MEIVKKPGLLGCTDYYFLDNENKKISLNECLIEDIMNIGGIFLTRDMLKVLIPILKTFEETGYFPKDINATLIRGCCVCELDLKKCGKCQSNIKRNNGKFVYDDLKPEEVKEF